MGTATAKHWVSVAGVVTDERNRALMIQRRDNQHWEPPGGVLETGESITDGLIREVREETGLDVEPVALTGIYKNITRGIIALVFRCEITGGELTTNDEAAAFRWASEADVVALASEAYAVRVLDALDGGAAPAIRQHDGERLLPASRPGS